MFAVNGRFMHIDGHINAVIQFALKQRIMQAYPMKVLEQDMRFWLVSCSLRYEVGGRGSLVQGFTSPRVH